MLGIRASTSTHRYTRHYSLAEKRLSWAAPYATKAAYRHPCQTAPEARGFEESLPGIRG